MKSPPFWPLELLRGRLAPLDRFETTIDAAFGATGEHPYMRVVARDSRDHIASMTTLLTKNLFHRVSNSKPELFSFVLPPTLPAPQR